MSTSIITWWRFTLPLRWVRMAASPAARIVSISKVRNLAPWEASLPSCETLRWPWFSVGLVSSTPC
jgi:hypothetical protein